MPTLKTEFSCPKCKKESGMSTQILANEGKLTCPANSNHRWDDTAAFYADGAVMEFKVGPATFPPPEGQTPITIKIPLRLKDELEKVHGAELSSKVATVLLQLAEGDVMMIGKEDLTRLRDRLGRNPENSSDLVGMVYAKICEADDAKGERDEAVKDLKAFEGISIGRVVIDLGQYHPAAAAKARDEGLPVKVWVENYLRNAFENNWI